MTTRTKVVIIMSLFILFGGLVIAGATHASGRKTGRHHGEHDYAESGEHGRGGHHLGRHGESREGRHMGRRFARLLEAYDSDRNGQLTQAEVDAARAARLATFDTDGDRRLTLQEYQGLWLDAMHGRMVDRFQELDENGDATVSAQEFGRPFARIVQYMDRNDDGEISGDDLPGRSHGPREHRSDSD